MTIIFALGYLILFPSFSMNTEEVRWHEDSLNTIKNMDFFDAQAVNIEEKNITLEGKVDSVFEKKIVFFPNVNKLDLSKTDISNIEVLHGFKKIKNLNISHCNLYDSHLKKLPESLEILDVSFNPVTGSFIKKLPKNICLKELSLRSSFIDDYKKLSPLLNIKTLKEVDLSHTYVSLHEKKKLTKKLEEMHKESVFYQLPSSVVIFDSPSMTFSHSLVSRALKNLGEKAE